MKKIFVIMMIPFVFSCASTPVFVNKMQSIHNDLRLALELYDKEDYRGSILVITPTIEGISEADDLYKIDKNYEYHTESLESGWEKIKFAVNAEGRSLRSDSFYHLGKYDEAYADANWVLDYCNKNKSARQDLKDLCREAVVVAVFVRGEVYRISKNDYKLAIKDFDWVVKNSEIFGWLAYESRGRAYLGLGNFKTAYDHFNELIKQYPDAAEYYALRCYTRYEMLTGGEAGKKRKIVQQKKLDEIGEDCAKAINLDPNNELAIDTGAKLLAYPIGELIHQWLAPLKAVKKSNKRK